MTQRSYKPKFLAILLFSLLALMMFTPLQATLHQNEDRLDANLVDSQLSKEKVSITQNERKDNSMGISSTQPIISKEFDEGSENYYSNELQRPCDNGLVVRNNNGTIIADSRKAPTDIKLVINEPGNTVPDYAFRGDTVTVEGQLYVWEGDYWNGETVYLYYNVTKYQFESAPLFYQGNLQYEVGFGTTSGQGEFQIDLLTSVISANPFSKIGKIDLFTYFWGHTEVGRGSFSPGNVNVTFYGSIDLDVTTAITNPGQGYTITSQCYFDNGSVVDTQGNEYTLKVEWWVSGTDFNGNRTFGIISPYNDIYSGTAPLLVQDVDITVFYNFAPLGLTFFRDNDSVDPENDRFLAYYNTTKTDNQVVVDAYFEVGILSYTKTPVEVVYGSTFTVFANLTSDTGAEPSKTIRVTIIGGGGVYIVEDLLTDLQAEIRKTYDLTSNITDITDTINIHFEALSSEFGAALLNDDDLTVHYAINIYSIEINLYNNPDGNFYTPGEIIYYNITVIDEAGNKAPLSRFSLTFPEIGLVEFITEASGNIILNRNVPDFTLQTENKTIQVDALNETQVTYRYNVIGVDSTNVTFNTYYDLTLTFTDPQDNPVADWTEFNNTFYSSLTAQAYNLTVRDQFGRKPLGAMISITLAGDEVNNLPDGVTSAVHYVLYTVSDLDSSGLDLSIAYPAGLVITANVLPGLVYAESITHTIYIYGPDYDVPQITAEIRTPDPLIIVPHEPYFDVTFTVTASDVGTGINFVKLFYQIYEEGVGVIETWTNITLIDIGGGQYEATLSINTMYAQNYIQYYIEVKDFAGYGLTAGGTRQAVAQYDVTFGWITYLYNSTHYNEYQIGDYEEPVEEGVPVTLTSPELDNPWFNITVFVNDSLIYTDISSVRIYVNRSVEGSDVWEENYINDTMTNVPGTNQWFYVFDGEYNYEYTWYYIASDNADPTNNAFTSVTRNLASIDSDAPVIGPGGLVVDYTGIVIEADTVLNFTIILTDERSGIQNVTVYIYYNGQTILVNLTQVGTTNTYFASFNLSIYPLAETSEDPFPLNYYLLSYDIVNNLLTTPPVLLSVVNPPPVIPPGGSTDLNLGALIGGVVGGLAVVIIALFFWINRHSLQTYAKKQTLRRRLRDYLREIIEEIKRDGVEGRYKEGLIKMWNVVEGVGREFYELPRYKHQTPMEFAFLLAAKAKIQKETMATITYYFEKARYSHEPITEEDYNAGVRALLKTIDQLEVSKMEIET